MMSEGIDHAADSPAVLLIGDRPNNRSAGCDRPIEYRIRIIGNQHHPYRTSSNRRGAEIQMLRRFVGQPEYGVIHAELRYYRSLIDTRQYDRAECSLVEFDGRRAVSDVQQRADGSFLTLRAIGIPTHEEIFSLSDMRGRHANIDVALV